MKQLSLAKPLTVIFCHPDDEVLFFLFLLQKFAARSPQLICVTGRFGTQTTTRLGELHRSAAYFGGALTILDLEDRPHQQPLDRRALESALAGLQLPPQTQVVTHGPMGEYGHRHHLDVFTAVLKRFGDRVWCLSGPLQAHFQLKGEAPEARHKEALLRKLYPSQPISAWASGTERLTHLQQCPFGSMLQTAVQGRPIGRSSKTSFLKLLKNRYLVSECQLPPEIKPISREWNQGLLRARFQALYDYWDTFLSDP